VKITTTTTSEFYGRVMAILELLLIKRSVLDIIRVFLQWSWQTLVTWFTLFVLR